MNAQTSTFAADSTFTRYVETGGVRLAYRVIGAEKSRPLILSMRFRDLPDRSQRQ